jgi:hypothetical protein
VKYFIYATGRETPQHSTKISLVIYLIHHSTIQTEDRRERDALNEKPEFRNLFICNEVRLSSIRESDKRTGLDKNSRLWKIFSSMTQAKKRMKREAHSTA